MVAHTCRGLIVALVSLCLLAGCASSPYVGTGAALGGGVGALAGAAIGNRNPWAGAIIGGLVGSAVGAAGGYAVQQRQQPYYGQPQGYYQSQPGYYPAQPGYNTPPPRVYGQYTPPPAPGPGQQYNAAAPPPDQGYQYNAAAPGPTDPGWVNGAPAPEAPHRR